MGILKRGIACIFVFALSACTSSTHTGLVRNQMNLAAKDPRKVQVFLSEPPRRSKPIAVVAVARDGENATWAVEVLKMEAAELGADAIANLEMSYSTGFFPTLRVQGVAIQYE